MTQRSIITWILLFAAIDFPLVIYAGKVGWISRTVVGLLGTLPAHVYLVLAIIEIRSKRR